jgi:hypothetical protein
MLEKLPLLVLEQICEYLTADTFGTAIGFASLCQTNKYCYEVTRRARDSRLSLTFDDDSELTERLEAFSGRHEFIRTIVVDGSVEFYGLEDFRFETLSEGTMADQSMWQPLARFLLKCRGLKELVWESWDQVPRCILDVLHDQLPRAHLHVNTFDLRSLHQHPGHPRNINLDEYMLATSPNLRIVNALVDYTDSDGSVNYNHEAILQMIAGLAPNLHEVTLGFAARPNWSVSLQPEWRGFFADEEIGSSEVRATGKLVKFTYADTISDSIDHYSVLQRSTDCTLLESLGLMLPNNSSAFQMLINMAENDTFKSLRELELQGKPEHLYPDTQDCMLERLLTSLPPLQSLLMHHDTHPFDPSIFSHHGKLLTKFHVRIPDSVTALQKLRMHCPQLRNLQFTMRRTCGDKREVLLYQELGSFPKLSYLNIYMELGDDDQVGPGVSDTGCFAILRWTLANSAMDDDLASEIFD